MEVKELSIEDSRKLLYDFQILEQKHDFYLSDWFDAEDDEAIYIWVIENSKDPRGFLSYKKFYIADIKDFIYIVKIYVLKEYRGNNPQLVNNERVSNILFNEIFRKGIDILTLESADEKLDTYYENKGFIYNQDLSTTYSQVIDSKNRRIMVRENENNIPEEELEFFR